jgi:hypothetical protein
MHTVGEYLDRALGRRRRRLLHGAEDLRRCRIPPRRGVPACSDPNRMAERNHLDVLALSYLVSLSGSEWPQAIWLIICVTPAS